MTSRLAVGVMAAALAIYLAFCGVLAVMLISAPDVVTRVIGIGLIVLAAIGAWLLIAELLFVIRGGRLLRLLGAEGGLPVDDLPRRPSGRIDPEAGKARFADAAADAEENPAVWRSWLRLSLAYDAAGDRPRARWAARRAIRLSRGRSID